MKISRKQNILIGRLLELWVRDDLISEEQAKKLKGSIEQKSINWKRVAQNMLGLSVFFMVIAFLHLVADEWVLTLIERFFSMSDGFFMALLFFLSLAFPITAPVFYKRRTKSRISVESFLLMGTFSFAGALYYFASVFNLEGFLLVLLVLLGASYPGVIGLLFKSSVMWLVAASGVVLWFGLESSRLAGEEITFLGMNYPVRFFLFSIFLLGLSRLLKIFPLVQRFYTVSVQFSLLMMWVSLWFCTLFGNYSTWDSWDAATAFDLLPWGLLMAVMALFFWKVGLRRHQKDWFWMGSIAMLVNLYTQYFLFLWDVLSATLFFFILALSFLILGRKAEVIWGK